MAKNPRLVDMSGSTVGMWTVVSQTGNAPKGGAIWLCRCQCGTERPVLGSNLRSGKSFSCGCVGRERTSKRSRTHGETNTRLHRIWGNMRSRCRNPKNAGFKDYGGRGITIAAEWDDYSAFRDWALSAGYTPELSIERLDVNGNYEPSNCIWAGAQAQSENRRFVAKAPSGQLWVHIARDNGITDAAFRNRLHDGWSYHQAATWPMGKKRRDGNLSRARFLNLNGQRLPVAHAAKAIGYSGSAIHQRAKRHGISMQEALDQLAKSPRR